MIQRLQKARGERGFTLIELLIVIIILGILAAIVVFAVSGITDRGNEAACRADYKNVEVAQEASRAQNNAYQANVGALQTAGFLRDVPSTTNGYIITTDTTGVVFVDGADAGTGGTAGPGECASL